MEQKSKMLIDATHPEETRVVVLRNGRVEEFDYESAARKPLRGNIYLAKVTRVEPSLQAAFVDYGGNRHGFLAFSEIHPDYYQIPYADRQALLQEEADAEAEAEAEADARAEARARRSEAREEEDEEQPDEPSGEPEAEDNRQPAMAAEAAPEDDVRSSAPEPFNEAEPAARTPAAEPQQEPEAAGGEQPSANGQGHVEEIVGDIADAPEDLGASADEVGADDAMEEVLERPRRRARSYRIQEVIKRRQIILVQVVKEERGSKGAALTTYLSLAGRYTVLMPNTGRGGGISRKITNAQDRKRLKVIAHELEVPEGMGLIVRTAGAARTKQELKRDFEYLLRLWENVRDMTLQSTAPCLVYEEGNLIKRSIRDLYTKDTDEILVAGESAHKEAHDFMRMLSPSQAKNVVKFDATEPLFARYQIERQLNAMFSPYVTLRSGGYIVINQTEALVSIDVNSGKATREFSIEETALQTNLEAAEEISRQLKLRDLAGLIVIDFIDMEERRNNRKVESRLKDALRHDRARIQVGRISHFGLLEMSRQRLRTGVVEGSTSQCPHCQGTGTVRSTESVALAVLRALEDQLLRDTRSSLVAVTTAEVALYILNNKRAFVTSMEHRHGVSITVEASPRMQGANFAIEKSAAPVAPQRAAEPSAAVNMEWGFEGQQADEPAPAAEEEEQPQLAETDDEGRRPRRRRRRGGRRDEGTEQRDRPRQARVNGNGEAQDSPHEHALDQPDDAPQESYADTGEGGEEQGADAAGGEDRRGRRRRRGRRGGRRGRDRGGRDRDDPADQEGAVAEGAQPADDDTSHQRDETPETAPASQRDEREPEHDRQPEPQHAAAAGSNGGQSWSAPPAEDRPPAAASQPEPKAPRRAPEPVHVEPEPDEPARPARKGWWQRRLSGE